MDKDLTHKIIGAAIEVHRVLGGPGLLESVYEEALCEELSLAGLSFKRQQVVPLIYKGKHIKNSLILDIVVENQVIIEVKATEKENAIFEAQLRTYLRLTGIKLGLLINFGKQYVKDGISRIING